MISIIIPVHERAEHTKKIVEELIRQKQDFPETEIICVENGSTEDMSFLKDYPIVYLECEKGVSRARNTALDIAKGDYFCFIDNDDWIPTYYLQTIYSNIQSGFDYYVWQWWCDDNLVQMSDFDLTKPLKSQWALWGYCWSRKLFDGVRFDLNDPLGDTKVFDILDKPLRGYFIQRPMYRYSWQGNDDSICHILNAGKGDSK